jgi:hypothetical protein
MLKRLLLMHYTEDHSETLNQQGIQQAKLLANGPLADEIPPHVIILCPPSPQAKKIAEIIATKFSVSRWVVPVEITDSLGHYDDTPRFEQDNQALQDIETAMQQNSVVIVVTDPLRIEGISRTLGQDVRLKNAECLVYERQQVLNEIGGPFSLAGRLTANYPTSKASAALPTSSSPKRIFHIVPGHLTSRGVRNGALISAACLAALGIIAEVDGHFGLSGLTEIKVVAGQEQLYVHIPLIWFPTHPTR